MGKSGRLGVVKHLICTYSVLCVVAGRYSETNTCMPCATASSSNCKSFDIVVVCVINKLSSRTEKVAMCEEETDD